MKNALENRECENNTKKFLSFWKFKNAEAFLNSASFIRIIFIYFHIIALKVKFSMRRKNSHAESIMEESYEGNRNCTSD